jgi:hypothetical protein
MNMKTILLLAAVGFAGACAPLPESERPIRTQADVERYNATVSSLGEQLVCEKERVVGSNLPKFVCMTYNQRERLASSAVNSIESLRQTSTASGE